MLLQKKTHVPEWEVQRCRTGRGEGDQREEEEHRKMARPAGKAHTQPFSKRGSLADQGICPLGQAPQGIVRVGGSPRDHCLSCEDTADSPVSKTLGVCDGQFYTSAWCLPVWSDPKRGVTEKVIFRGN